MGYGTGRLRMKNREAVAYQILLSSRLNQYLWVSPTNCLALLFSYAYIIAIVEWQDTPIGGFECL
jgi:hypothetical protein